LREKLGKSKLSFYESGIRRIKKLYGSNRKKVCKEKDGNIRNKNLKLFNMTLLIKWKQKLSENMKGLWKQILKSKYNEITNMDVRGKKTNKLI